MRQDTQFDKDIFKTNFMLNSTASANKLFNDPFWNTGASNGSKSENKYSDFNSFQMSGSGAKDSDFNFD